MDADENCIITGRMGSTNKSAQQPGSVARHVFRNRWRAIYHDNIDQPENLTKGKK
jgi:hypothetical protein